MAITKKQRDFNYQVVIRALNKRKQEIRNFPDVQSIVAIANSRTTASKNKKIRKVVTSAVRSYRDNINSVLDDNIRSMVKKTIKDHAEMLAKRGIKFTPAQARALEDKFVSKYNRESFLGMTRKQRLTRIVNRFERDLTRGINRIRKVGDEATQKKKAKEILDTLKGTRRGYYEDGGRYNSFSLSRSTDRLIASEVGRSQRKITEYVAEEAGIGYVKWMAVGDKKTCPICRMFATSIFVPYRELPLVHRKGIFRVGEVPNSHPYCRCKVVPIPYQAARRDPSEIDPEMEQRKREVYDMWREQQAIVATMDEKVRMLTEQILNIRAGRQGALPLEDRLEIQNLQSRLRDAKASRADAVSRRAELRTEYNNM